MKVPEALLREQSLMWQKQTKNGRNWLTLQCQGMLKLHYVFLLIKNKCMYVIWELSLEVMNPQIIVIELCGSPQL